MPKKMKKQLERTRQKAFIFWVTRHSTRRNEFFGEGNILLPEVCLFTLSILHTWSLSSWNIDVRRDLQCYKSLHFSYCKNTDTSAIFKLIHMHFGPYLVYGIVTIGTCIREDDVASWCMLCLVAIEFIMINENVYAALPRTKLHTPG